MIIPLQMCITVCVILNGALVSIDKIAIVATLREPPLSMTLL